MIYANSPKKTETKDADSATALATEPRADSKEFYNKADSMSGQDKENPVFWWATQASKMGPTFSALVLYSNLNVPILAI